MLTRLTEVCRMSHVTDARQERVAVARQAASEYRPEIVELSGDLHRGDIIELLQDLRFGAVDGYFRTVVIDRDARDFLVRALKR
jgi:hypothetical protein